MSDDEVMRLCDVIRETSYSIHCYHQAGHLEKIYENVLVNRLSKKGINLKQQFPLKVFDEDGAILGDYFADLFVEDCLIVELKACRILTDEHIAQILGYLKSSKIKHGLLINFGAPKLQIKKCVL
ncbi:MAG: GxxExxY protein [Pyrinomonadaceae bacterium]